MKISSKHLIGGVLIGLILIFASIFSLSDGKLHLVFCDVGQGDAIYIKTATGDDILIDGGPNEKVLSCLGKHMPFYDRTIELMILSHPQADHLTGLISVIERYNVKYFVSSGIGNETEGFKRLENLIKTKTIDRKTLFSGEGINLDGLALKTIWPKEGVLGASTSETELNSLSLVLQLSYGNFDALLTGDAGAPVLEELALSLPTAGEWEVLKVPHHGSKTSLATNFLEQIKPRLAVISVGKNSYGHPAEETLKILRNYFDMTRSAPLRGSGIASSPTAKKILRTDEDGEIEIVSDGKGWYTKAK